MIIKDSKNPLQKISEFSGLFLILITVIFITFFTSIKNPDYFIYKLLFQVDQNEMSVRTYFYYLITNFFNNFLTYEDFRFLLAAFQSFVFLTFFRKIYLKYENITFFICLPIVSFLLLKVHVQIRESIAILIWFITLLDFNKFNIISFRKIILGIISFLIHPSSIILWIPSLLCVANKNFRKLEPKLISLFFFLIAFYIFSSDLKNFLSMKLFSANLIDLDNPYFVETIKFSFFKILYFFSYLILFISIYLDERRKNSIIIKPNKSSIIPYVFGSISIFGLLSFLPTVWIISFFKGVTSPEYNLIVRTLYILFFRLLNSAHGRPRKMGQL